MTIATTNPATGRVERTFDPLTGDELDRRIGRAADAYAAYRLTRLEDRAAWMAKASALLEEDANRIAAVMTTEMGKTVTAARGEALKCAAALRFYAEHAAEFLADRPADARAVGASRAYLRYEPLGPVLAVMPW